MLKETEWKTINAILLDLYTIENIDILSQKMMKMFRMLIPYTKGYFVLLDADERIVKEKSYFIGMDEDAANQYIHHFYQQDYLNYLYDILTETSVYKDSDILDDTIRKNTDFYQKFLKPVNIPYGCGILLIRNGKMIGIFNLFRNRELGDFTPKDSYILELLKKHLENIVYRLIQQSRQQMMVEKCCHNMKEYYHLTEREEEILRLVSRGLSNNEISEELVISISTVKKHIYNLYHKAGVKSRTQLINILYEQIQ